MSQVNIQTYVHTGFRNESIISILLYVSTQVEKTFSTGLYLQCICFRCMILLSTNSTGRHCILELCVALPLAGCVGIVRNWLLGRPFRDIKAMHSLKQNSWRMVTPWFCPLEVQTNKTIRNHFPHLKTQFEHCRELSRREGFLVAGVPLTHEI